MTFESCSVSIGTCWSKVVEKCCVHRLITLYNFSSGCALSTGCLSLSIIPSLEQLHALSKGNCFHRIVQVQSLLRNATSKITPRKEWVLYGQFSLGNHFSNILANFFVNFKPKIFRGTTTWWRCFECSKFHFQNIQLFSNP